MPWVMSITRASGAILAITPWQVPTKSSWSPKSLRNEIGAAMAGGRLSPGGGREPPERSYEPFQVVLLGLAGDLEAEPARSGGRLRADGEHGQGARFGAGERTGGRG